MLIPINNSDTAWLIVADFNQDNSIGYPDCLRDDIISPNINDWDHHEYVGNFNKLGHGVGSVFGCGKVGNRSTSDNMVGMTISVGVGGTGCSFLVGGHVSC